MKYYTDQILSLFMYLRCIIMTSPIDFAKHFALIREAHKISSATLASVLGLKGSGNISSIEKGNGYVTMDTFIRLSEIFAVEMSWFMNHTPYPYREESMVYFENLIAKFPINNNATFIDSTPYYYSNLEYRRNFFSLQERANLVFLMNYHKMLTVQQPKYLEHEYSLRSYFNVSLENMRTRINNRTTSFRFKDSTKEYLYVLEALASILFDPCRIDTLSENNRDIVIPSKNSIYPLYVVGDLHDTDGLSQQWLSRPGDIDSITYLKIKEDDAKIALRHYLMRKF